MRARGEEALAGVFSPVPCRFWLGSSDSSVRVSGGEEASEVAPAGQQPGAVRERAACPRAAEESVWSRIAQTPERVLMTYQVPAR